MKDVVQSENRPKKKDIKVVSNVKIDKCYVIKEKLNFNSDVGTDGDLGTPLWSDIVRKGGK